MYRLEINFQAHSPSRLKTTEEELQSMPMDFRY